MTFYLPNPKRFSEAFHKPKDWFKQFGDSIDIPGRPNDLLVHQDNGKKILVVCHTDYIVPFMTYVEAQATYVLNNPTKFPKENTLVTLPKITNKQHFKLEKRKVKEQAKELTGPVVDDRLGCAIALGMSDWADLLFTDCEEKGASTAAYFKAPRDYNWIVGLDRRGTDVVTYQYKDKKWLECLGKHFKVGFGSWSDIGYLEGLGRSAVNVGIGYHNEHTQNAFWNPRETNAQISQLWAFWKEFRDKTFTHEPAKVINYRASRIHDFHPRALNPTHNVRLNGQNGHLVGNNHDNSPNTCWIAGVKNYWNIKIRGWMPLTKPTYPEYHPTKLDKEWDEERKKEWADHLSWLEEEFPYLYDQIMDKERLAWPV